MSLEYANQIRMQANSLQFISVSSGALKRQKNAWNKFPLLKKSYKLKLNRIHKIYELCKFTHMCSTAGGRIAIHKN